MAIISSIGKVYSVTDTSDFVYKIEYEDGNWKCVPNIPDNRDYKEVQDWIEQGNTITVIDNIPQETP